MQHTEFTSYNTFNNNTPLTIVFQQVTHIIADADADKGCWLWFTSGKSVHINNHYQSTLSDFATFWDNVQHNSYSSYNTFNNGTECTVFFNEVTHIISDADNDKGCWIWFTSSKCIHVSDLYNTVIDDLHSSLHNNS